MAVVSVVGAQWGDEGKGRIVDYLAQKSSMVIRYQGGDNAGHTVVNEHGRFALHIIPSGIFNDECANIVGAGTVVNFDTMASELEAIPSDLRRNLFIDGRAHLILPWHRLLDGAYEALRSPGAKVGTTGRGIGPCYSDKAARVGLRAFDLLDPERLRSRLEMLVPLKNKQLGLFGLRNFSLGEVMGLCMRWRGAFGDRIIDTVPLVMEALDSGRNILLEGQLGIMRDLDWGIYPYCTSSNPTSGGASNTSAVPPTRIGSVIGVVKAYSTSVGGGPFVCELMDEDGERLRRIGAEFGATTGRPRRCGWLDGVALEYASRINGFTEIALTKLDVLSSFERIKVCVGYRVGGGTLSWLPETSLQEAASPVYEELPGWMEDISSARTWDALPPNARRYVRRVEELAGARATLISVGPERSQMIEAAR